MQRSVILLSSDSSRRTLKTAKFALQVFSNIGLMGSVSLIRIY
jgi:hypothetical protein